MSSSRCFASALALAVVAVVATLAACGSHDAAAPSADRIDFLVVKPMIPGKLLTWDDLAAMQGLPDVGVAAPYLRRNVQLASEDANWNVALVGTTPELFIMRSMRAQRGTVWDAKAASDKVVVLGELPAKQLFGAVDPVGQVLRIGGRPYTVIGVLAHQGVASTGQDLDDQAFMPSQTFGAKIEGRTDPGEVFVQPRPGVDAARVEGEVRDVLRARHQLAPGVADDFTIRVPPAP